MAAKKSTKADVSWSDVKTTLADCDRAGLISLVHDLYAAGKDNKAFLHARFGLGDDPLAPYKDVIIRWINPPDCRRPLSVGKAKKAISDYKKAMGRPEGLAELTVFYCEEALGSLAGCGTDDEGFYDALVRMFAQALKYVPALPEARQAAFLARLDRVRRLGRNVGWGVGDAMNALLAEHGLDDQQR